MVRAPCAPLSGMLHLGRYPSGADDTTRAIAADLNDSGFEAPVSDAVMAWKYAKLLGNLANAVEAVFGTLVHGAGEGPALDVARRAQAEGRAVLDAAGIAYTDDEQAARMRDGKLDVQPMGRRGLGSSWQSLMRGTGSIETDYLNGEIVLLGRRVGVPVPVNEELQRVAGLFAREGRRPGELTDRERAELLAV